MVELVENWIHNHPLNEKEGRRKEKKEDALLNVECCAWSNSLWCNKYAKNNKTFIYWNPTKKKERKKEMKKKINNNANKNKTIEVENSTAQHYWKIHCATSLASSPNNLNYSYSYSMLFVSLSHTIFSRFGCFFLFYLCMATFTESTLFSMRWQREGLNPEYILI